MAAQASTKADAANGAFHLEVTVHGDTSAQRAVMMAELDIGVMVTPRPQPNMHANASTAGGNPSARRIRNDGAHERDHCHGIETELSGGDQQQRDKQRNGERRQRRDQRRDPRAWQQIADGDAHETGGAEYGCLGADGWHTQQEPLGAASQQTRQAVPRRTGEAPGLHGEPHCGDQRHDQRHAGNDGDAEQDCRRFGEQHDQQDEADDTAVDHPGLGRDGPCTAAGLQARAGQTILEPAKCRHANGHHEGYRQ